MSPSGSVVFVTKRVKAMCSSSFAGGGWLAKGVAHAFTVSRTAQRRIPYMQGMKGIFL